MKELPVDKGTRVTLHFALKTESGEVIDSNFDKDAATLEIGDESLPENFEAYLMGMKAGDKASYQVPPEKAFGQRNPNNLQTFKRHEFSADMVLDCRFLQNPHWKPDLRALDGRDTRVAAYIAEDPLSAPFQVG